MNINEIKEFQLQLNNNKRIGKYGIKIRTKIENDNLHSTM